ncbi:uncharacterized protein [Montipora capricornis]|uniref:uncharacterized protein n=1 Tax=Montipora capricornis TaxID=246305 RepID=UPI0035F15C07
MSSNICQQLIKKKWRSYANYLKKVPVREGIYAIGKDEKNFLYVGHSENMRKRLREHKYGRQEIDSFVKEEFRVNGGVNLQIKWMEERDHGCVEGQYLDCLYKKLGYWPEYNKKRGNTCQ